MAPVMRGIDHVHIYVGNWTEAEQWYRRILGFTRVEKLSVWAVEGGPLTLKNTEGTVHVALFESEDAPSNSTIAFGATGEQFLVWMEHFKEQELEFRLADHSLAWSINFATPSGTTMKSQPTSTHLLPNTKQYELGLFWKINGTVKGAKGRSC